MLPEPLDLRKVRARLDARRAALRARYGNVNALAEEERATGAHELVDVASEQWDARVLSEMTEADAQALDNVIAAIHRLDAGRYGWCAVCEQAIEPARLSALPEAVECAGCARFAETTRPRSVVLAGER